MFSVKGFVLRCIYLTGALIHALIYMLIYFTFKNGVVMVHHMHIN